MLPFASDSSAGYQAGGIFAVVALVAATVWLTRRTFRQPAGRARVTDAIAALVCAVLLAGAIVRAIPERQESVWETDQGRQMQAGFVAGCQQSSDGTVDCACLFDHLTSGPPGDTPSGFTMLGQNIQYAGQRDDWSLLRPQAAAALRACAATGQPG